MYDCVAGFKIIRQLNHLDRQNSEVSIWFFLKLFKDAACENRSTVIAQLKTKTTEPVYHIWARIKQNKSR
jgi:hypothetical protein